MPVGGIYENKRVCRKTGSKPDFVPSGQHSDKGLELKPGGVNHDS